MPYLSAISNYLPSAETVLNTSNKCEKVLFHLFAHCFLATSSVVLINAKLLRKGREYIFLVGMNNQLSKSEFDEEIKQKFFLNNIFWRAFCSQIVKYVPLSEGLKQKLINISNNNSIDLTSYFTRIGIQLPFVPFVAFIVTNERAHQLGQLFCNAGLKSIPLSVLLIKITAALAAAFFASVAVKIAASRWLNKEYDWESWADYWEKHSLSLQIHFITTAALTALDSLNSPIFINAFKK